MAKTKAKKISADPIANQFTFVAQQTHIVAERLHAAGFDEIGAEVLTLANSIEFFAEEFDRQRHTAQSAKQ